MNKLKASLSNPSNGQRLLPFRWDSLKDGDLDFLAEYQDVPEGRTAASYFGLLADLRGLFGREIDLVERDAIRNPYFLRAIAQERLLVYAA